MPDVGVLNLQIQENSVEAEGGLRKLEDALVRIKNAVSGGLKLTPIANGIEKIGKAINDNISGSTIVKLGQIADELSKLKGLENVNIRISGGSSIDSIRDSVRETRESISSIDSGFDEVGRRVVEVEERASEFYDTMDKTGQLMKNTSFGGGYTQFRQMLDEFLRMRSSMALGPGTQLSNDVEKGWTEWKNGAIEVEGIVSDTFEKIEGVADVPKLYSGVEVFDRIEDAAMAAGIPVEEAKRQIQEMRDSIAAPENAQVFNTLEEAAHALGISMDEARRQVRQVVAETTEEPNTETFFERMSDSSSRAERLLDLLREKVSILREEVENGTTATGNILSDKTINSNRIQIEKLNEQIEKLQTTINASRGGGENILSSLGNFSQVEIMGLKYEEMRQSLIRNIDAGKMNNQQILDGVIALNNYKKRIDSVTESTEAAEVPTKSLRDRIEELSDAAKNSKLGKLLSQFARIAKYRFLRTILKHISSGFSEGVQNVYEYSKAIGGSFAPAMDSAASAMLTMKNSIGAAAAPLIQSLIPVIQTLVNWFIEGVNWLNQFFALLRGQTTWTRAVPATTSAFDKQTKAAKSTGNAIKDLLADWDELNIIQSQTSGAGSGAGTGDAEDYLKMFEEAGRFDNSVKDTVGFIKNNFDSILNVVEGIGAGILLWKISDAFGKELNFLQKLEVAAGLTLMISGVKLTTASGYDIGKNGLNSENLLGSIDGIFRTALGGGLIGLAYGGLVGAGIGLLVGTTIGLFALGASMAEGEKDALYGDIRLTAQEIQTEVDKLFKLDVNAELTNATVDHNSVETAKTNVQTALHDAEADYATFKLKVDHGNSSQLMTSVSRMIDSTNILLDQYQKKISIGFGFDVNFSDPKYVQMFSTDKLTGLEKYITGLGNKIGEILEDGIVDAIEAPLLDDLMKKLNNVTSAIATGKASGRFTAELERGNYSTNWANVDRASIQAYAERYTGMRNDLYEAGYYQALDTRSALGGLYAGMLQRNIDEPGTYTEAEIQQALDNYRNYDMDNAIQQYVDDVSAEGRKVFIENMMTAFGSAVSKANGQMDYSRYGSLLSRNGDLKEWINSSVASNLGWNVQDFSSVMDAMGMSGLDILTDEMRRRYIIEVFKKLGENNNTYGKLQNQLGISMEEINAILNSRNGGSNNYLAPIAGTPTTPSTSYVAPGGGTSAENERNIANGVQIGMSGMQADQRNLLNELIRIATQISQKNWTVNVTPGSDWGRHNARSEEAYSVVTGNGP